MKVNVVGLGYIGLPTALSLAANNVQVVGVDKSQKVLDTLMKGEMTFKEEGMEELFEKVKKSRNLSFSTVCETANIYSY